MIAGFVSDSVRWVRFAKVKKGDLQLKACCFREYRAHAHPVDDGGTVSFGLNH